MCVCVCVRMCTTMLFVRARVCCLRARVCLCLCVRACVRITVFCYTTAAAAAAAPAAFFCVSCCASAVGLSDRLL